MKNLNSKLDLSLMTKCHKTFELPEYPGIPLRCRKCPACVQHRKMEWKNRLMLEQYGKDYRPLFLTWTMNNLNYVNTPRGYLNELQKLYKRLRKEGHKLRYFTSIERGSKGRLHAHSILWSRSLSTMPFYPLTKYLREKWNQGAVNVRYVHSVGAFAYTAKYISKGLTEHIDVDTGLVRSCRNYTWSNKPGMGTPGINRWRELSDRMDSEIPANWFNQHIFGKLEKTHIPSSIYMKYVKSLDKYNIQEDSEIISGIDFDSLLLKWLEDQKIDGINVNKDV